MRLIGMPGGDKVKKLEFVPMPVASSECEGCAPAVSKAAAKVAAKAAALAAKSDVESDPSNDEIEEVK